MDFYYYAITELPGCPFSIFDNALRQAAITLYGDADVSARGVSDEIFAKGRTGIIHGALAMLMRTPKKPWTHPQLGEYHRIEFNKMMKQLETKA